jgi:acid stress-induced BolA-like protein IbaG/YrbA
MFKIFFHLFVSIILLEQTLFASPILRTDTPLKFQQTMKTMLDISNNLFHSLAMRAQTQNGLTKKDKKLLAILIIDWMREKARAKQQNTVYWYLRQG